MKRSTVIALVVVVVLLLIPGGSLYYSSAGGEGCARCHEIRPALDVWRSSAHRSIACSECHGSSLTLDVNFHAANLHRLWTHWQDEAPPQIRIRQADVARLMATCRKCHRQEFANWQAGPHSITFQQIFLDKEHNRKRLLMDDCLRCHGMYFEGSIQDLVTPIDTKGPWQLRDPALVSQPAIPCLACHSMHREGSPLRAMKQRAERLGAAQELVRPSLALFDRRELKHLPLVRLGVPAMLEGSRAVRMSPDPRQGLCYQCHAPLSARQVNSGDDRTGIGVHEGLSCLACHQKHTQQSRASCATCHPRLSNCGLDVEKMDTTYVSEKSKHNIHFVKCADCHPKGVPPKKPALRPAD